MYAIQIDLFRITWLTTPKNKYIRIQNKYDNIHTYECIRIHTNTYMHTYMIHWYITYIHTNAYAQIPIHTYIYDIYNGLQVCPYDKYELHPQTSASRYFHPIALKHFNPIYLPIVPFKTLTILWLDFLETHLPILYLSSINPLHLPHVCVCVCVCVCLYSSHLSIDSIVKPLTIVLLEKKIGL